MTQVLFGDRETLVDLIGTTRLVVVPEEKLDKYQTEALWRRRKLVPENLALMDPPEPVKGFPVREGSYILFAKDKVPAAWARWCEANSIKPKHHPEPSTKFATAALTGGFDAVAFTPEAAQWYVAMVGTSLRRIELEMMKFAMLGISKVTRDHAVHIIGGEEAVRAEKIWSALGTKEALVLAQTVEEKKAIPLMVYLSKCLEAKGDDRLLALQAIRRGGDLKRYDYWTGVQMFVQYCYARKRSAKQDDRLLALLSASGVVSWSP